MKMKHVLYGIAAVFAVAIITAFAPNNNVEQTVEKTTIKNEKVKVYAIKKGRLRPGTANSSKA